jgi:hypothetical protein
LFGVESRHPTLKQAVEWAESRLTMSVAATAAAAAAADGCNQCG